MAKSILHVLPALGTLPIEPSRQGAAGISSGTLSLADQQASAGDQVTLIGWAARQRGGTRTPAGTKVRYLQSWSRAKFARWDLRWALPVVWETKNLSPEILHIHSDPSLLLAAHPQARVFHFRTPVPDRISPPYQKILSFAEAVICNSGFIAGQVRRKLPFIPSERIYIAHNAADLSFFEVTDRQRMRAQWGLDADDFIIVYAGAIVPEKGVDHAVSCFRQVSASVKNARLVVIGSQYLWPTMDNVLDQDSQYHQRLEYMSERLPVHFVGALSRTEMPFALAAADIVVVPSLWDEPFGTIVVEAMAAGAPVIAYRSGGIPESIEDNITGILVQPGNMSGLADAIIYLYQHTPVRRQMAAAARQRAADRFTWEIAAQKIDRIYEMALSKRVNHRHR